MLFKCFEQTVQFLNRMQILILETFIQRLVICYSLDILFYIYIYKSIKQVQPEMKPKYEKKSYKQQDQNKKIKPPMISFVQFQSSSSIQNIDKKKYVSRKVQDKDRKQQEPEKKKKYRLKQNPRSIAQSFFQPDDSKSNYSYSSTHEDLQIKSYTSNPFDYQKSANDNFKKPIKKDEMHQKNQRRKISQNNKEERQSQNQNHRGYRNDRNDNSNRFGNNQRNNRNQRDPRDQRSQTSANQQQIRQVKQIVYQNRCYKYLKAGTFEVIDGKDEDLTQNIKKLKKLIYSTDLLQSIKEKPKQIAVLRSTQYPAIFLRYQIKGETRYMKLSQIQRTVKNKLFDFHTIVKSIFDMYYYPVDVAYEEDLLVFAQEKARQTKLKLIKNKHFRQGEKQFQRLLYYGLNKHHIAQLVLFDQNMKQCQFGQHFIRDNRSKFKAQFETFQKFTKAVRDPDTFDVANFGQQQVESQNDEQYKTRIIEVQRNRNNPELIKKIEKRLLQLLKKDVSKLNEKLQNKNDQLHQMMQNNNDQQSASRLEDQVDQINRNLQNFQKVRTQVNQVYSKVSKQSENIRYQQFRKCLKRMIMAEKLLQSKLPILGKKRQIFQMLDKGNLIVLQGQTGSGKSTQLPQLLCQYYKLFQNPDSRPVLITQPRKIATRSLAERVSDQLEEPRGGFVDYVTSSMKYANPKAKIVFKLDRLVLDEIVDSPLLINYSCLVIDEAHERTISIDVILGLVKKLLLSRKDFKVIITSASMETALFEKYFKQKTLKVSGRLFPVEINYYPPRDPKQEDLVKKVQQVIDYQLLTDNNNLKDKYKGHILVFCSDTSQIDRLCEIFQKKLNPRVFQVLPLHGKLTPDDQKKVFTKTKQFKLIFCSRIAQTAITIDGVKVVIDPGYDRQMIYDQQSKFSSMKLGQISQSSAKQRAGRAGRTQDGFCFRLYTYQQFKNRPINKLPQIKTIALETLILRLKTLGIENVSNFDYIEKPNQEGMKASIELLKMIGCLDQKDTITQIGLFLVKIPIQPFLARAIIEGLIMQKTMQTYTYLKKNKNYLTQSIIQMLCMILNANNLFRIPQAYRQRGQFVKYKEFSHEKGDFFFLKNIYDAYMIQLQDNRANIHNWLKQNFLMGKTLRQVKELVRQILDIVKNFQIDPKYMKNQISKCKSKLQRYQDQQERVLSCLTTSFCANLCLYSGNHIIGYTYLTQKKTLSIYGTSCLSLLGICPKWILTYDLYENKDLKLFCRVANEITYDFLCNTVDDYVFNKFKIGQADQKNPFYKQINYKLETLILKKIKDAHRQRQTHMQSQFLKNVHIDFDEESNQITIFLMCNQKDSNTKTNQEKVIEEFIDKEVKKAQSAYEHNYIGKIYVKLENGLSVKRIQFTTTRTVFQIIKMEDQIYNSICLNFAFCGTIQTYGNQKIKFQPEDDTQEHYFEDFLNYSKSQNKKFEWKKQLVDTRRKIPQAKIYLHWYAGKCQRNNALLMYPVKENYVKGQRVFENQAQNNIQYLIKALRQLPKRIHTIGRRQRIVNQFGSPALTKKGNAINVFNTDFDQIQIHRFLLKLQKEGNIDIQFQMPTHIKKFRQPQRPDCQKKDQKWIEEIKDLIEGIGDKKKQNCIRVWGYKHFNPKNLKQQGKLSALQKSYRVDMKAQIRTFDINLLKKLQEQYEGKIHFLGCQKMHVTSMFDQVITTIDRKIYQNLYDQYIYNVDNFKVEYPTIMFDVIQKKLRVRSNKTKLMIIARSQNRQDLIKPMRILNELFTPKYIILQDSQFKFLNSNQGDNVLYQIEEEFQFKIYFGFDKYQRKLKLYCHDKLTKSIQQRIKFVLSKIKTLSQTISYRGKNLKRIEVILKQKMDELNQKKIRNLFINYEIKFGNRLITLYGDQNTFKWAKSQINNIKASNNNNDKECQICTNQMISPYKLFNCFHQFCWFCLASQIRQAKLQTKNLVKCSYYDEKNDRCCIKEINIYDIMTILSQQQLQKLCDVKISQYVQNNKRYFYCHSANCEQIFDIQMISKEDNQLDCQLCGKTYCLKCGQTHKNYSCEQWKNKDYISDSSLKQFGIRKCPNCGVGIQKNQGCQHVSCKCQAHICWTCMNHFKTSKQCYDHLAKKCGGIFANPVRR